MSLSRCKLSQQYVRPLCLSAARLAESDPELMTLFRMQKDNWHFQRPEDHPMMKYNEIVYPPQGPDEPRRPVVRFKEMRCLRL